VYIIRLSAISHELLGELSEHPQSEFIVARKLIIAKTSRHRQARQSGCRRDGFFRQKRFWGL
jgi:hypothetical protein